MPHVHITWNWKTFAVIQAIFTFMILVAIWVGSWVGRSEVVVSQRDSCYRGQNDRIVLQLTNSDMSQLATIMLDLKLPATDRVIVSAVKGRADERIADVAQRLPPNLDCKKALQDPGPFALPGSRPKVTGPIDQPEKIPGAASLLSTPDPGAR